MGRPKKIKGDVPEAGDISPIITPLVKVTGENNILEDLWAGNEAPELKSIGFARLGSGWVSYVMTTKGKEVINIQISEPDKRGIAEESSKINFVTYFMDTGI